MSVGAAIASVTAESVIAIVQFYFVKKYFSLLDVLLLSKPYLLASTTMFLSITGVKYLARMEASILSSFILIVIGIVVYSGLMFVLRDEFFMETFNKLIRKVRSKI